MQQQGPWLDSVQMSVSALYLEHIGTYTGSQIARDLAQTNCGVRPNARLLVVRGFCQMAKKLTIHYPVRQLGYYRKDSLYGLFPDNGRNIRKASHLVGLAYG